MQFKRLDVVWIELDDVLFPSVFSCQFDEGFEEADEACASFIFDDILMFVSFQNVFCTSLVDCDECRSGGCQKMPYRANLGLILV